SRICYDQGCGWLWLGVRIHRRHKYQKINGMFVFHSQLPQLEKICSTRMCLVKMKGGDYNMSDKIHTREFCISDYDAALQLWHRVEGLEIAEGDERECIAQFLARNPGLGRIAV